MDIGTTVDDALRRRMVTVPFDVETCANIIRALSENRAVFRWFRRLAALTLQIDGDVLRKALKATRAISGPELSRFANSAEFEGRVVLPFVVAALLVNKRIDAAKIAATPYPFDRLRDNFERGVALLSEKTIPTTIRDIFRVMVAKQHVRAVLLNAGYLALGASMSENVSQYLRTIRLALHGADGPRGFTEQWTVAVGHMVLLAFLTRAQDAGGIVDFKGVKVWDGVVANNYLWQRMQVMSPSLEVVPRHTVFADNHTSRNLEWVEGRFVDVFEACGIIADRAGDRHGAIMARPTPDEPALQRFRAACGLDPADRIVTLHCRESGFRPNEVHDLRNADIATYVPALRALVARGYRVVRLGDPTMRPLPAIDGVIDYAASPLKTEELDILLPAAACFHIGSSSGLSVVPMLFGRPCLFLNWYPYDMLPWGRRSWTVVKPVVSLADGRRVVDRQIYATVGQMRTRPLLNGMGHDTRELQTDEVTRAVEAFVEAFEADTPQPAEDGPNIGRILVFDDQGRMLELT